MAVGETMGWLWLAAVKYQMYNVFFHSLWIQPFALSKTITANFSSIATSVLIFRELYEVEWLSSSRLALCVVSNLDGLGLDLHRGLCFSKESIFRLLHVSLFLIS